MRIEAELIHRIIAYMPADTDQQTQRDAERLLSAAFDVATDSYPDTVAVRGNLEAITTGTGCWVDEVRRALVAARDEFPEGENSDLWPVMCGALFMASAWLSELHRANNWNPVARPAPVPHV